MADVEASDPSKEVPAQEATAPAKPVKKTRISRPERPSRDTLNKDLADVNAQIAECQKRIQEIRELFDGQRQGRQGVEGEIQVPHSVLADFLPPRFMDSAFLSLIMYTPGPRLKQLPVATLASSH